MKRILTSIVMLCLISTTFAQGDYEAFRFSQIEYQGTARYMGAGGAFSATGGEFSAISVHPAAIGLYKRQQQFHLLWYSQPLAKGKIHGTSVRFSHHQPHR